MPRPVALAFTSLGLAGLLSTPSGGELKLSQLTVDEHGRLRSELRSGYPSDSAPAVKGSEVVSGLTVDERRVLREQLRTLMRPPEQQTARSTIPAGTMVPRSADSGVDALSLDADGTPTARGGPSVVTAGGVGVSGELAAPETGTR